MIVVTGANGQLGRLIVARLCDRMPASAIGVSVRDAAKAADLAARGIRVRQADFDDEQQLAHALEGAQQLLMISSNALARGGDTIAQHDSAIRVARQAGVRRIVYTSHMAANPNSLFPPARVHAATEEMLRHCGLAWTALRNGFYASSGLALLQDALTSGVVEAPADGPISWTTHADLAEAAAKTLTAPARLDGPTPPLVGTQALDLAALSQLAARHVGRPVERRVVSEEQFEVRLLQRGLPPPIIAIALGMHRASRNGEFSACDPTLEQWIDRPPQRVEELIAEKFAS